mmetsp:Transcript_5079/g.9647  ORF Transcript_5079/g.9647 Transcript_5079/m.9647 type:complete len:539 (-) Transcript_5079:102-1718(-)
MKQHYIEARHQYLIVPRSGAASPLLFLILVVLSCLLGGIEFYHRPLQGGSDGFVHSFSYHYAPSSQRNPHVKFMRKYDTLQSNKRMRCCNYILLQHDNKYLATTTALTASTSTTTTGPNETSSTTSRSNNSPSGSTNDEPHDDGTSAPATTQLLLDLGPPEVLQSLHIGQHLEAFRTKFFNKQNDNKDMISSSSSSTTTTFERRPSNFTIERVSYTPDAFILRNFLTHYECSLIQSTAQEIGMKPAETITQNDTSSRKNCTVAWLSPSSVATSTTTTYTPSTTSLLVSNLLSCTANILLSKNILSNPSAGVEDLQVLRYGIGGEFVLHHDGEPRVLTVIYYLNGVGGTWFPLARTTNHDLKQQHHDNVEDEDEYERTMERQFYNVRRQSRTMKNRSSGGGDDDDSRTPVPQNKEQALDFKKGYQPGTNGLLVQGMSTSSSFAKNNDGNDNDNDDSNNIAWVQQGDALAFYNYYVSASDGSGGSTNSVSISRKLDWRALHCGLPMTDKEGEKWIANHWFRVNDLLLDINDDDDSGVNSD